MRMPRISVRSRIGAAAAALTLAGGATLAMASPAWADPANKPAYTLDCGGTIYHVVSPDHAATGSDVNSTSLWGSRTLPRLLTWPSMRHTRIR